VAHYRVVSGSGAGTMPAAYAEPMETTVLAPQTTVAEIACAEPRAIPIFEQLGLDYTCGGKRSLEDAATSAGCTAHDIIESIVRAEPVSLTDWSREPLSTVIRFLISDHGYTIEQSLPLLREMTERTISNFPAKGELKRIRNLLSTLTDTIVHHAAHEEKDLFVIIGRLEATVIGQAESPLRRIAQLVLREYVEHASLRENLRTMRELACRARIDDDDYVNELEAFRRKVHYHMHVENNVLYPRAIAVENALRRL